MFSSNQTIALIISFDNNLLVFEYSSQTRDDLVS